MYCYNCMSETKDGQVCDICHGSGGGQSAPHHLSPGQVLHGKYLVGNSIGEGGFGITYIGRDLVLDIKVAIKEFYPNGYVNRNNAVTQNVTATTQEQKDFFTKGKVRFLEEAKNIAKFIDEPGVVGVREFFEANGTAYIIMDYLDGINLSKYVRQNGAMPADMVFKLMLPIIGSLQRIHNAGIIHRDISPDNIMYMKNGTLKLMDFGSARYFANEEKEMSVMLKQGYAPEEQYRKNGHQGPWTDVYGLCATIYRCITGVVPLDALDRLHEDKLRKPSQMGVAISPALEAVLMYGLAVHRERRYRDMQELKENIEKAFGGEKPVVYAQPPHSFDDVRFTDKTMGVEQPTYGDNFTRREYEEVPHVNEKSSSGTGVVIGAIVVLLLLIVAVGAFFYFVMPLIKDAQNKDDNSNEVTTSSQTSAPTEKPTDDKVSVPDVTDMSVEKAIKRLNEKGFMVETNYIESNQVESNHVVSQMPSGGEKTKHGDTVQLYVATSHDQPVTPSYNDVEDTVKYIDNYYEGGTWDHTQQYKIIPYGEGNLDYKREYIFEDGQLLLGLVYKLDSSGEPAEESHWYYFDNDQLVCYYNNQQKTEYYRDDFDAFNEANDKDLYLDEARILEEAYGR